MGSSNKNTRLPPLTLAGVRSVYVVHPEGKNIPMAELEEMLEQQVGYVASIKRMKKGYIVYFYDTKSVERALHVPVHINERQSLRVEINMFELDRKVIRKLGQTSIHSANQ
eukprot:gnl/Chilomastix_caulleri/1525.p1 GENE.gnl/Chilomastix_caulleri/1525~~gnl/Chilomastix_caulleri/1525.p1  ORF type:complete len:111 (+),score=17.13 gnl/Chilomastix_caulleri/1525:34-366(+)